METNSTKIKTNSLYAWFLAARPKTLTGAAVPVIIGTALAIGDGCFNYTPALLCFVFAFLMQIASNFINDLIDFRKGSDREDRLGPERACAQGWITPKAMSWGIAVTIVLASVAGLCLLAFGGKWLIIIGLACIAFAFLYTTILSYCGLGDLLVLVFFGLVPVVCTYYVQSGTVNTFVFLAALGSGFAINALLVVNNYRDREADKKSGKNTIIVRFGERFGQTYYLATGVIAVIFALSSSLHGFIFAGILPVLYLPMHIKAWRNLVKINKGKELNKVLGMTSANMMMYAFLVLAGFILDGLV